MILRDPTRKKTSVLQTIKTRNIKVKEQKNTCFLITQINLKHKFKNGIGFIVGTYTCDYIAQIMWSDAKEQT